MNAAVNNVFRDLLKGKETTGLSLVDQEKVFELFKRHRLLSLAPAGFMDQLNPELENIWRDAIRNYTLLSMKLTAELLRVCTELNRQNLEVCSIKGPVLAQRLYKDVGKRHYTDLDLLVKRERFTETVECLTDLGYEMIHPNENLSQEQWDYYFRYKKDVALKNRAGVVLELHVEIFRMELIKKPEAGFSWESLVDENLGNISLKCLDLATSFLYLLYHGGQHQYFRLFWLKDIDAALRKWDLDHKEILEKAKSLGVDRLLGMGLLLSQEVFGTEVPREYDKYIDENKSVLSKLKKLSMLRISGPERETRIWKIRRYRFVLLLQPGFGYYRSIIGNIFHRRVIRKKLGGF